MDIANLPALRPATPTHAAWRYWTLFGLGALMVLPVMLSSVATLPFAGAFASPQMQFALLAFFGSSLPEEAVRFAVLTLVGMCWFGLARPRDGLIFGLVASLGFSFAENLFYGVSLGWATGVLKLAVATPVHVALGLTMGGLLAAATRSPRHRLAWLATAFAVPLLLHGVYDLTVFHALASGGTAAFSRLSMPVAVWLLVGLTAVLIVLRTRRMTDGAGGLAASV